MKRKTCYLTAFLICCAIFTGCQLTDGDTVSDAAVDSPQQEAAEATPKPEKPEKPDSMSEDLQALNELIAQEEARAQDFEFINIQEYENNTYQTDDTLEIQFDLTAEYENGDMFSPYVVDIGAYITTPSGETVKAIGFYKQTESPSWAFRYYPEEVGTYSYYLVDNKNESVTSPVMEVVIEEGEENRGKLRVSGNKIVDQNGDQFIPVGTNLLDYPLYNNEKFEESFSTIIPKLAQEGGANYLRVWGEYHAGCFQLELAEGTYVECGIEQSFGGLGQYNLENAKRMDELLQILQDNDMYLNLTLFNQWSFGTNFSKNAYNKEVGGMCVSQGGSTDFWSNELAMKWQEQLIRYYSARYSASRALAVFEYWNEVDSSAKAYSDNYTYKWLSRMNEYWDSINVNNVLTSSSYAWKDHASQGISPWIKYDFIDIAQTHYYIGRGTDPVNEWITTLQATKDVYEGPTFIGEFSEDGAENFTDEEMIAYDGMSDFYMLEGFWSPVFLGNAAGGNLFWKINQNFIPNQRCLQFMKTFSDKMEEYGDILAKSDFVYEGIDNEGLEAGGYYTANSLLLYIRDTKANDSGELVDVGDSQIEAVSYLTKNPRMVSECTKTFVGFENGEYLVTYWDIQDGSSIKSEVVAATEGTLELGCPEFSRGVFVTAVLNVTN